MASVLIREFTGETKWTQSTGDGSSVWSLVDGIGWRSIDDQLSDLSIGIVADNPAKPGRTDGGSSWRFVGSLVGLVGSVRPHDDRNRGDRFGRRWCSNVLVLTSDGDRRK